jgi:hypothetical protein
MTDDGGVLGNLPRSRPGQRSHKRAAAPSEAPKPSRSTPKRAKPQTAAEGEKRPPIDQEPNAGGSPVGDVVRAVTSLAAGGARLAGGTAREVLRRLPRP